MISPSFSVEEIEQEMTQALKAWREWRRYLGCVNTLSKLFDALQSGEVAILSREDRETGYELAFQAGFQAAQDLDLGGQARIDSLKARALLKLDVGETP